jgi:hypothetical protein
MGFFFRAQTLIVAFASTSTTHRTLKHMNNHGRRRRGISPLRQDQQRAALALITFVGILLVGSGIPAAGQDAADLAEGMRLFQQKGDCQACHGWAGDGRKMDSQMPDGADLRAARIDRQTLIATIKCGRPGTGMPAFDKFAYSDGRCFGLKQADLRTRGLQMTDPPATLTPNEIGRLADFLLAKIVGKGPLNRAQCTEFWSSLVEACGELGE